jgi:hypothetical protein
VGVARDQNLEKTGEIAIIVIVDKSLPDEEIDPHDQIPSSLEGCEVNVRPGSNNFSFEQVVETEP